MTLTWKELLKRDHETIERVIAAVEKVLASKGGPTTAFVSTMLEFFGGYADRCHNIKEEKHLFPLIAQRGIPKEGGPLAVMLHEHEIARGLVARLQSAGQAVVRGDRSQLGELQTVFAEYGSLLKDHYWKENDILYPMAEKVMQGTDGAAVVAGIEAVEASLGPDTRARYYTMADELTGAAELKDLSLGLDRNTLAAILNKLPVELSFVDRDDVVRYFGHEHSEKIFGRSRGAIGTNVRNCHPQKSLHVVEQILADFKAGKRKVAEFWIDLGPRKVHIRYWPVHNDSGEYIGCLETVQDVTSIIALKGQQRLLQSS